MLSVVPRALPWANMLRPFRANTCVDTFGLIGVRCLSVANKINNKFGKVENSIFNQVQTQQIYYGGEPCVPDSNAIISLVENTVQGELEKILSKIFIKAENEESALRLSRENPNALVYVPE